jgi:hypothetical protein
MYALLVNLAEPPMRFKILHTGSEQTVVRSPPSLQALPSNTTKPLYGADNETNKICGFLFALLFAFALATLFTMRM